MTVPQSAPISIRFVLIIQMKNVLPNITFKTILGVMTSRKKTSTQMSSASSTKRTQNLTQKDQALKMVFQEGDFQKLRKLIMILLPQMIADCFQQLVFASHTASEQKETSSYSIPIPVILRSGWILLKQVLKLICQISALSLQRILIATTKKLK